MAKVLFEPDNYTVEAQDGTELQHLCEDNGVDIPFSCKNGVCGTCLCTVKEGADKLSPKSEQEQITLETLGAEDNERLACQVKVYGESKIDY